MATKELKIKIDTAINAEASIKTLKELKKLQKEVGAGSDEFKKLTLAIDDVEDSLKGAKTGAADWVDSLERAGGPLGLLGKGINGLKVGFSSLGAAIKTTGIGLLVSLVGGLVAAFSQSEGAMKKLQPLFIGLQKILGGIFAVLEPILDVFVELALKALPYFTDAIGVIYSTLYGFYTFVKDSFVGIGKTLVGIFTLDLDTIKEGWSQLTGSISSGVDAGLNAYKRYEQGTKELTKIEKEELEKRQKAQQEYAEKRKAVENEINNFINKSRESRGKTQEEEINEVTKLYNELLNKAKQYGFDTVSITQAYNEQVLSINKKFSDAELERQKKAFDDSLKLLQENNKLVIDELQSNANNAKLLYGENSKEYRAAQDQIFEAQRQALQSEKELYQNKLALTNEDKNRLMELSINEQNLTNLIIEENQKRIETDVNTELKRREELKKASDLEFQDKLSKAEFDLELQTEINSQRLLKDKEYYDGLLSIEGLTNEQRAAINAQYTQSLKANADAQVEIEKKKFEAQQMLLSATASAILGVADLVGKNTVVGKSLAIAASLINTYSAIAGQLRAFAGIPIPGYAILQAVATGAVGLKAVADIAKTPVPSSSGAGGGGTPQPRKLSIGGLINGPGTSRSDLIPAMLSNGESVINAKSTSLFKPLLSAINEVGGGRRFANGGLAINGSISSQNPISDLTNLLSTQQSQPIKAYVVAQDMSNQQMMDRQIKSRSTL